MIAGAAAPLDLSACEAEPIRIPGSIQSYGCLLALKGADGAVVGHSANAPVMLGRPVVLGTPVDSLLDAPVWPAVTAVMREPADARPRLVDPASCSAWGRGFEIVAHAVADTTIVELLPRWQRSEALETPPPAARAPDMFRLCIDAAERIRALAGYDRVMVYRFHPDWTGEVIAEVRCPEMVPYLGLRYPASDIPAQARQLYCENLVRMIVDVGAPASPLVLDPSVGLGGETLDLGHAVLRSVSPYHLDYMRNMGVAASLTLSVMIGNELWGMVSCHHRTKRQVGYMCQQRALDIVRSLAAAIAELRTAEAEFHRAALSEAVEGWKTRLGVPETGDDTDAGNPLLAGLGALKSDLQADGAAVLCGETCLTIGATPDRAWLVEAARRVAEQPDRGFVRVSNRLGAEAGLPGAPDDFAGAMIAILPGPPLAGLFVFRTAFVHEVHWGGDPRQPALISPTDGSLSPRRSFALWRELVRDQARPWGGVERGIFEHCADWLRQRATAQGPDFGPKLLLSLDDRAQSYLKLGESQRLLADVLPEGLAVLLWISEGSERRLLHANRALVDILGLELADLLQSGPEKIFERTRLGANALDMPLGVPHELDLWSPTRGARRVEARREHLVRYQEADGREQTAQGLLLVDVTGASRAHEALVAAVRQAEVAESARASLLRNMSHELRTPLNAIIGYSDLLAQELLGPLGDAAYCEAAEQISASAKHLVTLVDSTLELARLGEGQLSLSEAPTEIGAVLTEAARMVQRLAETQQVDLRWTAPAVPVIATVDPLAVRQIAINLLNNAIKFTPQGGTVTLELVRHADGDLILSVADTGIGIPEAALGRLFQPFSQVDSSFGRRQGGSGLGLSIVKALAQLHGGSVSVESAEGRGSTFVVRLPAWRLGVSP